MTIYIDLFKKKVFPKSGRGWWFQRIEPYVGKGIIITIIFHAINIAMIPFIVVSRTRIQGIRLVGG
jgi:vacuolar-type H+-ATPase subunit I/STV1